MMNMKLLAVVTLPYIYSDISLALTALVTESGNCRENSGNIKKVNLGWY